MTGREPLRFRALWLVLGWAMVVTVIFLSLVRLEVDLSEGKDKWSHFIAYGAQMFWFCLLYDRQWRLAAGFVVMGTGLEVLQGMTGFRSFDTGDMFANAVGVLLGWLMAQTPLRRLLCWVEGLLTRQYR